MKKINLMNAVIVIFLLASSVAALAQTNTSDENLKKLATCDQPKTFASINREFTLTAGDAIDAIDVIDTLAPEIIFKREDDEAKMKAFKLKRLATNSTEAFAAKCTLTYLTVTELCRLNHEAGNSPEEFGKCLQYAALTRAQAIKLSFIHLVDAK